MTQVPILVSGATGRLGRVVVAGLRQRGASVRVLARQPEAARILFGDDVAVVQGDLDDPASLAPAVQGVARLFLLSPISPRLAQQQIALVTAAKAAGARRVVKLSGSDWTLRDPGRSVSGEAHLAVEQALAAIGLEHVALRPNAWMQVALARAVAELRDGRVPADGLGGARVSYIDLRDIAEVAVDQLLADHVANGPRVLTGARAFTLDEIADIGQTLRGAAVPTPSAAQPPHGDELPAFVRLAHGQFGDLIRAGVAAGVTPAVQQILGRPPRRVEDFLREQLQAA